MLFYDPIVYQMATITDLLRDTIRVINEITVNSEKEITDRLASVITLNGNVKASTIERYMTFMNEHIFTKLSKENPLEDLRRLVPLIEKLVVLVSDDGLSLEQALTAAQEVHSVIATVQAEAKKPVSFACAVGLGKQIVPALKRLGALLKSCHGPSSVAVVSAVDSEAPAVAVPAVEAQLTTEQPQPAPLEAPAPPSHEGREAEPSPAASYNTNQKEDTSN